MIPCETSLRELEHLWGGGKLSNEELIGCLLRYLARQEEQAKRQTQHSTLKTPSFLLGTLLRQIGDVLDALTGQQLELWHAEGLWYWRWEDSDEQARCGLASYGEALVDAVERRYPDELLPAALRDDR